MKTGDNTVALSKIELELMLDRAAKRGAREALQEIGLSDETARKDVEDMRSLLTAYRDAQSTFWKTAVKITTTAFITFIGAAVWAAVRYKINGH